MVHPSPTRSETSFVGRTAEVAWLREALERATPLLVLTGPAGIGKTRLAAELLREVGGGYRGGAFFCPLVAARTATDVRRAVSGALELSDAPDFEAALERTVAARGPTLLVIDDFESCDEGADARVVDWVARCPELHLVVTSRRQLDAPSATVLELGPLDTEGDDGEAPSAVALFLDRAGDELGGSGDDDDVRASVRAVVRELAGVPLAIEVAARRLGALGPADLALFLARGAATRASPVAAALESSWVLLGAAEQDAFARLSVFSGGFDVLAASQVLARRDVDVAEVLGALVRRSLVRVHGRDPSAPRRFDLYPAIAAFARAKLEASGHADEAAADHAEHYAGGVRDLFARLEGRGAPALVSELAREEANLRAVLGRRAGAVPGAPALATAVASDVTVDVACALGLLYTRRGPLAALSDLLPAVEDAVAAAENEGTASLSRVARARLSWVTASARRLGGRLEGYDAIAERALALADEPAARWVRAATLVDRARLALQRGDEARLTSDLHEARALAHAVGSPALESVVAHVRAEWLVLRDDLARAMEASQECSAQAQRAGDPELEVNAALMHVSVLVAQQRLAEAVTACDRVVERGREASLPRAEIFGLLARGVAEMELGAHDAALADLGRAADLAERKGEVRILPWSRAYAALTEHDRDRLDEAVAGYEAALSAFRARDERWPLPIVYGALAAAEVTLGRTALAETHLAEARAAVSAMGGANARVVELYAAFAHVARGQAAREQGDAAALADAIDQAERTLEGARAGADEGGSRAPMYVRMAARALGRALDRLRPPEDVLALADDGSWFRPPFGEVVSLAKKNLLRTLLRALVEAHEAEPGAAVTRTELCKVLWPGAGMDATATDNRLYVAVAKLRLLGLRDVIRTAESGWCIEPTVRVVRPTSPDRT